MTAVDREQQRTSVGHLGLGLAMLFLATTASAQSAVGQPQAPPALTASASAAASAQTLEPFWALIGGFEGDTHGTGYGFFGPSYVRPIGDGVAFTARVFGNYLYYEFDNGAGLTKVTSPGVSTAAGVRFGGKNFVTLQAGPSFKSRKTKISGPGGSSEDTDGVFGFSVGGDVYANPAPHTNVQGIVDYGSADKYIWSRLGVKQQITNLTYSGDVSHHVGGEVILQGNDDIRSTQFGGLVEFAHSPSSVSFMVRAGYKRSTFQFGPDKTGPYFGVGFYKQLK